MRLGIVGTGAIAREVLPQLRAWGYEPAALCGTPRSREITEALCAQYQIKNAYSSYEAMLVEAKPEAVYLAVPNQLHFQYAEQALLAGAHVIVEKPMAANFRQAEALARLAKERGLFLFEAISTRYLPNYRKLGELLPEVGRVRLVSCNFSQYSRRYDAFRAGQTPPVFDPACAGGALMDLNLYNLHWLVGLFGAPKGLRYGANLERGIDTGGILTLDYGDFRAVSIAAKDCAAPACYTVQGDKGCLLQTTPANHCGEILLHRNDGREERFNEQPAHRLQPEFQSFLRQIESGDRAQCEKLLADSLTVAGLLTAARRDAGIVFPADE